MMNETITLPWPPTVNTIKAAIVVKGRTRMILSKKGRQYFDTVAGIIMETKPRRFGSARLKIIIFCYPPDRRRRDLGNLDKVLMDSLQKAGVYDDDSQIDVQTFFRGGLCKNGGRVVVRLEEIIAPTFAPCPCPVCKSTNLFNEVKKSSEAENDIKVAKKK